MFGTFLKALKHAFARHVKLSFWLRLFSQKGALAKLLYADDVNVKRPRGCIYEITDMGVGQMKLSSIKVSSIQGILFNDTCVSVRNPNYRALISVETKADINSTDHNCVSKYLSTRGMPLPYELYTTLFLLFVDWLLPRNADSPRFNAKRRNTHGNRWLRQ